MIRGDHFEVKVTSNVREHLASALALVFADERPRVATHFRVEPVLLYPDADHPNLRAQKSAPALWLWQPYPGSEKDWTRLPFPLDAEKAGRFAWDWLSSADHGTGPDCDGSVKADAFTVLGGSAANRVTAIIIPTWSVYGK